MQQNENQLSISPLRAGLTMRCPRCGEGKLFSGFLSVKKSCSACELDYKFADAGDGPAVFIMLIVGFIVVGAVLYVELTYQPPYWLHAIIWPPLILLLSLGMLRPLKAYLIALQYHNDARQAKRV